MYSRQPTVLRAALVVGLCGVSNLTAQTGNPQGLPGNYEFSLNFAPSGTNPPDDRPTLFTALREQLGLKLEAEQSLTDVLVIDRVDRPKPD